MSNPKFKTLTMDAPVKVEFNRHEHENKWHIVSVDISDAFHNIIRERFERQMILEAARKKFGYGENLEMVGGQDRDDGKSIVWFVALQFGEAVDHINAIVTWKAGEVLLERC